MYIFFKIDNRDIDINLNLLLNSHVSAAIFKMGGTEAEQSYI
jgi:hypothetical protein